MNDISGVWIPVVAMFIPITAIVGGIFSQVHRNRMRANQRMALIARGVPLAEIDAYMKSDVEDHEERPVKDPMRSLGNARRAAVVLVSTGLGITTFLLILGAVLLTNINHTAGWAVIGSAAVGLIPLAIGIGFWFDYNLQKREMSRFGLEVEADRV